VKGGNWLSHRYVVNDYIILNEIGRGAFAEVRLCKNRTTNQLFAVKIMSRKEFDPKEVAIMKKLRHPNVLQLHEVLDDLRGEIDFIKSMTVLFAPFS
jgi:[calcium/calmodulin-dependent protein kinase] kinase